MLPPAKGKTKTTTTIYSALAQMLFKWQMKTPIMAVEGKKELP